MKQSVVFNAFWYMFPKLEVFLIFILKGIFDDGDDDDDDDDNDDDVVENLSQDPDRSSLHKTVINCSSSRKCDIKAIKMCLHMFNIPCIVYGLYTICNAKL